MKKFRPFVLIFCLFIGEISLTSCSGGNRNPIHQPNSTEQSMPYATDNLNDSNENKQILDSTNSSVSQNETLKKDEGKNTINLKTTSNENDAKNRTANLFAVISCVIAIISLVITLFVYLKLDYLRQRIDRHRNEIDQLRYKLCGLRNHGNAPNPEHNKDYASLTSRIRNIEEQVEKINHNNTVGHPNMDIKTYPEVLQYPNEQNGYFGNPINASEPYFKKMLVSRDSEARFSAVISGKRAIFKPLDSSSYLGTFISNDAMRAAVDFMGCTPSEASSMQVTKSGEAEQRDNKWIIIKKATILLS